MKTSNEHESVGSKSKRLGTDSRTGSKLRSHWGHAIPWSTGSRCRGVSIVEALIAIAIVGVLVAILIPVLRSATRSKSAVSDLSNMRQTMVDFFAFASSNRGLVVNAGTPVEQRSKFFYGANWGRDAAWFQYRAQSRQWPLVLAQQMEPGRHWHAAEETFGLDAANVPDAVQSAYEDLPVTPDLITSTPTKYRLGDTMRLAASAFGFPRATPDPSRAVRDFATDVRFHDIAMPSVKGVLLQREWWGEERGLHHAAFADGSVSLRNLADAEPTAAHPTAYAPDHRGRPVDCTMGGFLGVDW